MPPPRKRTKFSNDQPSEILFDVSARQDYLTGFHKRKVARKEHAKEIAVKREREDKIKERRQMREQRKEDLQQHVRDVNKELRKMNPDLSSDDEELLDEEVPITASTPLDEQEEEYVDEDKYTTVTVEAMGEESEGEVDAIDNPVPDTFKESTAKQSRLFPRKEEKKFRYESKHERQETRRKQKAKNSREAKARREKAT
ncbi:hypothetical protein AMS68_006799 [Peltaster fructicola]|uniref:Nucleolar protein 12 n=1 Tax=Peltaster fructicola TaxID=286661 RepID=A0A6H0Y2N4_9PEZI|nr:hypothetical protein AMS68_006799 [Peltaster fructicola]